MALFECGGGNAVVPTFLDGKYHARAASGEETFQTINATNSETIYFAIQVTNNATSAYTRVLVNDTEVGRVTSSGARVSGFGIIAVDVSNGDVITVKTWDDSDQHVTNTVSIAFTLS